MRPQPLALRGDPVTPVEIAATVLVIGSWLLAYALGRAAANGDAEYERARAQASRDALAARIEEGIAAVHARPQLHSVADVVPMRSRRENRDTVA